MDISKFPGVAEQLDPTLPTVAVENAPGGRGIVVTQTGEDGGMQSLFELKDDGTYKFVTADTVLDFRDGMAAAVPAGGYAPASAADHAAVAARMKAEVGVFSSKNAPTGQNLACVWAVRNIVHLALNRWITKVDGTASFADELARGYGKQFAEKDVSEGGIIISPTNSQHHGHVGLLGPSTGDDGRLVYSNSSSHGVWEQNRTLKSWNAYYGAGGFKLPVLFYPLPA